MRLIGLALVLPGGLVFAGCPVGFDFGYVDKALPLPACIAYSGSTLGGCYVRCDQLCVNMPNSNTPDSWGPVYTTGEECSKGGGDNSGGDNSGGDNSGGGNSGSNNNTQPSIYPNTYVGPELTSDIAPLFRALGGDINNLGLKVSSVFDITSALNKNLSAESQRTNANLVDLFSKYSTISYDRESMEALKSIDFKMSTLDAKISKPPISPDSSWTKDDVQFMLDLTMQAGRDASATKYNTSELSGYLRQITDNLIAIRNSSNNGSSGAGGWNQDSISFVQDRLYRSNENEREMIWALQDIKGLLESGSGEGEGGAGDKPSCVGPLCQFSGGGPASPSAMSNVFSDDDVAGIKTKYQEKQAEIKERIADIKSAMGFKTLSVSGQYETNIENIRGVHVDLSGRSNLELFFSSGPKQMIMVLALLIAISLVMVGNRKNG